MTIKQAIYSGYGEVRRRKKLVWTWYAANLLCAAAIIAPLVVGIAAALGNSLENQRLFDNFDLSWIIEFGWSGHYQQFIALTPVFALIGAAFVLLTTFLSGGALAVFKDPNDSFFAGCARWFPAFLRLFLWSLIGYALAFAVRGVAGAIVRKISDDSMSAQPSAYGGMFAFVLFWSALLFVNMVVDYAKIHMVTHNDRTARRALRTALRFVFANLKRTVGIFAALTSVGLLMLAVYHVWSEAIGQRSMIGVLVLFLARQLYMLGRTWLRLVFLASERLYFESRIPPPSIEEPTIESVPTLDESCDSSLL